MTTTDLRYKMGPNFTIICPACGCIVHDATVHTEWHKNVAAVAAYVAAQDRAQQMAKRG